MAGQRCQEKKWRGGSPGFHQQNQGVAYSIQLVSFLLRASGVSCILLYMMNTETEAEANGKTTTTINCCDCGGDYHPDDMKDSMLCLVCYDDRHCDDWTMEDC
jgi:hypothetical protein